MRYLWNGDKSWSQDSKAQLPTHVEIFDAIDVADNKVPYFGGKGQEYPDGESKKSNDLQKG